MKRDRSDFRRAPVLLGALSVLLVLYVAWICFEMASNPSAPGGVLIVVWALGTAALAVIAAILWRHG